MEVMEVLGIELLDAETGKSHNIKVTRAQYDRIMKCNDAVLATELVNDARKNEKVQNPCTSEDDIAYVEENSKLWQYNAVLALISAIDTRYDEFNHPKQRKSFFENVSNDLTSQGFIYNANQCHQKWKSLTRTYKTVKDNKKKTGRGPMRFMFYDQIDNILGGKPSISCEHTLSSSSFNEFSENTETSVSLDTQETSFSTIENTESASDLEEHHKSNPRKRKVNNINQYLELKKIQEQNKMKRHNDLLNLELKKLEIEKEKLKILETINNKL